MLLFYTFLNFLFIAITYAIFARVVLSWINPAGTWQATQIIHNVTEPILAPIRKILPQMGMFDLSPLIVLVVIQVLQTVIHP